MKLVIMKQQIRYKIENLVRVKMKLFFDNLTMAPIDKSLINKEMLRQIRWLNKYHVIVYKNLKKFMNGSELTYLKESCSNI